LDHSGQLSARGKKEFGAGKMDDLELREDSVFTPEQEELITQHDACSKNVSRCQCRAVVFDRFWLCPPPPPPPKKKKKSNMILNHIDVEHEGTGCIDC